MQLSKDENRVKLEKQLSEYLSGRTEEMTKMMQENKVDSIGVGIYVRNSMSYKAWKSLDWREQLPKAKIRCSLISKIKDFGEIM
ncbi:hypothetical protein D3C84_1221530 [compost metagenome]